jgi:hypothetical protein
MYINILNLFYIKKILVVEVLIQFCKKLVPQSSSNEYSKIIWKLEGTHVCWNLEGVQK